MTTPHPNAVTDTLTLDAADGGARPPTRLTTDRLVLRRAHPDHVLCDRLHSLFADVADPAAVFQYCGWEHHGDESSTRAYLEDRVASWRAGRLYEYVLSTRDDGAYVGTTCLEACDDGAFELGLWLSPSVWGRGLAGEQTDALLHVAFAVLDAPFVVAGTAGRTTAPRPR